MSHKVKDVPKNNHEGHRDRIRERIIDFGFESLQPHELLEYILYGAFARGNTNELAHKLIGAFGSVEAVLSAPISELILVDGVGKSTALLLTSFAYVGRIIDSGKLDTGKTLKSLGDIREYLKPFYKGKTREEFHVLLINGRHKVQKHIRLTSQNADKVFVDMSQVMMAVASFQPKAIVFSHNHPSGNPNPSEEDMAFTKKYFSAIALGFNITVSEHMIFTTEGDCYSFRHNGLLEKMEKEIEKTNGMHIADNIELGGF